MAINYKNYLKNNIGISANNTVYNPTSAIQSTLVGLNLTNTSLYPVTASVTLTSGSTTAYYIKNVVLPVGNALNVIDAGKLIITQNDVLAVTSSANNSVDAILSVIEVS